MARSITTSVPCKSVESMSKALVGSKKSKLTFEIYGISAGRDKLRQPELKIAHTIAGQGCKTPQAINPLRLGAFR